MLKPLSRSSEDQRLDEDRVVPRTGKVCILNSFTIRPNAGGPIGVIRDVVARVEGKHWELRSYDEVGRQSVASRAFYRLAGPLLWGYPRQARLKYEIERNMFSFRRLNDIEKYPLIWFHDLVSYFACRPLMKDHQRTVLQLHHPELPLIEATKHGWYNEWDLKLIDRLQWWALQNADVVVLANRGAEKIYGPLLRNTRCVRYLPNAICDTAVGTYPQLAAEFVNLVFLGRRNAVKGFDVLLDAFRQAHAMDSKLKLYILGEGARIEEPGIIDLGFSSVPEKWLAAADCVVIPNRSSYMDLNLLQALSLNKPVMMTCSQGHEDFRNISSAIYEIESASVEDLCRAFLDAPRWIAGFATDNLENRRLYEERYSLATFERLLDDLCGELLAPNDAPRQC